MRRPMRLGTASRRSSNRRWRPCRSMARSRPRRGHAAGGRSTLAGHRACRPLGHPWQRFGGDVRLRRNPDRRPQKAPERGRPTPWSRPRPWLTGDKATRGTPLGRLGRSRSRSTRSTTAAYARPRSSTAMSTTLHSGEHPLPLGRKFPTGWARLCSIVITPFSRTRISTSATFAGGGAMSVKVVPPCGSANTHASAVHTSTV